ncbi:MAG: TIGR01777 family oxidoreductase [Comamonas sp.]|nr:TIGR01777 family oxidoreductase [Comamonas sp.]
MHILLTGGTGLIGRALCQHWHSQGHQLTVLSRQPAQVAALCSGASGIAQLDDFTALRRSTPVDVVVNLAGAGIADRPWSAERRDVLWRSRIQQTETLVDWMTRQVQPVRLLLSVSAVGWYGDGGDTPLDESSPAASQDFGSELCMAWEQAAHRASQAGSRVAVLRIAPVLAAQGGMLARLLPPFRWGLGGRLGSGQQWMPWIHLQDLIAIFDHLLRHPDSQGIYNACTPEPVRNADFTHTLARTLNRPALLPAPAWVLRLLLGEMSTLLLGGQRLSPQRLQATGYRWQYPQLDNALQQILKAP